MPLFLLLIDVLNNFLTRLDQMKIPIYQVDAFTHQLFRGNPAAVYPLKEWLPDSLLQNIAAENNLSETAFYVKNGERYDLRWFTPVAEVDLCGHATLASGHIIHLIESNPPNLLYFDTRSGELTIEKNGDYLTLNFPQDEMTEVSLPAGIKDALNIVPDKTFKGKTDYMLVLQSQKEVEELQPDFNLLSKVEARGVIVTAPGTDVDFVSRFFAPQCGINEDPVTGSAHCTMVPYWSKILDKAQLSACQLSKRGGALQCKYQGDRVELSGQARLYLRGEIEIDR